MTAGQPEQHFKTMYELMIIGGGPAGMAAAVYAARKKIDLLMLSKDIGGQVLRTSGIENYLGYQYIPGVELMDKFHEQVKQFPIKLLTEDIAKVSKIDGGFEARSAQRETFQAKAAIIATGKRARLLGVPGEENLIGKGVSFCAICDGPVFAGENVAVIGGGNSALEAVEDMLKIANHVYSVSLTPFTGDQILIDRCVKAGNLTILLEHKVTGVEGKDRVEVINVQDIKTGQTKRLEVRGVFIEIGLIPNSELVKGLAKLNELGEIEVTCNCETMVPGLFAAGDVTNVLEKQIIIAAGEGAKAALQANKYLRRV